MDDLTNWVRRGAVGKSMIGKWAYMVLRQAEVLQGLNRLRKKGGIFAGFPEIHRSGAKAPDSFDGFYRHG
jgi:hypothetical protein